MNCDGSFSSFAGRFGLAGSSCVQFVCASIDLLNDTLGGTLGLGWKN